MGYNARAVGGTESFNGLIKQHTFTLPGQSLLVWVEALTSLLCNGKLLGPPSLLSPGVTFCPNGQKVKLQMDKRHMQLPLLSAEFLLTWHASI
jgi:hypothetical protein